MENMRSFSCKTIPLGIVLLVVVCLLSCNRVSKKIIIEGVYTSVSESEWALTVALYSNGTAQIRLENWNPGEYDNRYIETITGSWSANGEQINLKYKDVTDVLIYTECLSLADLGLDDCTQGLLQVPPVEENSLLKGTKLWKEPHEFSKNK